MNVSLVPALRARRSALDFGEKAQQESIDVSWLLELRTMAGRIDDGRSAPRDLIGNFLRPAGRQQLVAGALDHQRWNRDPVVGPGARRRGRRCRTRSAEASRGQG